MGRSGGGGFSGGGSFGGFGGGGRSGGFGGRSGGSFGGFGGGGRSGGRSGGFSGGRSGGNRSGGFSSGGGFRPPVFIPVTRRGRGGGGYYGPGGGCGGTGCLTVFIIFIVIVVMLSVFNGDFGNSSPVESSMRERTPLSGQVNKTDWYSDQLGWIINGQTMIEGLEHFYQKTGIQPYVMLIPYSGEYWNGDNLNADVAHAYLKKYYDEKFTDGAHMIFAYFEKQYDIKQEMEGEYTYFTGDAADTVMDSEALRIMSGYYNQNYYDTSLSIEQMIANIFSQTADTIMSRPTNGWDAAKIIVPVLGTVGVAVCVVIIAKTAAKRKKEKEEYTKEILETPLETFGEETDTKDLEDKYK